MSAQNPLAPPSKPPIAPEPIQPEERIQTIDVLRGFAIFGILIVNMGLFYGSLYDLLLPSRWTALPDQLTTWLIHFLAEGKFYPIFSFLFGLGFAIQLQRAEARGARIVPTYARRLLVLLMFGIVHAVLFWSGDILMTYALLGFVLLLFRNRHPRTLLIWAGIFMLVPILIMSALTGLAELAASQPESAAMMKEVWSTTIATLQTEAVEAALIYGQGNVGEQSRQRLTDLAFIYQGSTIQMFPTVTAMFLLGLYAGKRDLFRNVKEHLPLARRVLVWGLLIGLPLNLLLTMTYDTFRSVAPSAESLVGTIAFVIGGPALSLAYVSAFTLLMQRAEWQRRLATLAAVGRMALTNYLLQTLVCTTIFYSYGLGLYGQVGPAMGFVLTVVIYALQIPFSVWWLRRFRYGPMEWLWRTLTYGHAQPMGVPPAAPSNTPLTAN